jgi:hypothetical protein
MASSNVRFRGEIRHCSMMASSAVQRSAAAP